MAAAQAIGGAADQSVSEKGDDVDAPTNRRTGDSAAVVTARTALARWRLLHRLVLGHPAAFPTCECRPSVGKCESSSALDLRRGRRPAFCLPNLGANT
uniref:Uncharacterized protein n=1 Tax=Plectus sambesii TaxID=2011161 RepID=A0A914XDJ2_9BILA